MNKFISKLKTIFKKKKTNDNSFEDDEYQGECDFIAVELTDELSEALIGKTSSCERDEFLQGVLDYVFGIRKVKYIDYFVLWEVLYIEYKKKL